MPWAIYGATGYTGPLITERAVERGHRPLLLGRSAEKLAPLAQRFGLEHRAVALDDARGLRAALSGLDAVVHAAGPFIHTSAPMVQACLDERVSYLDITGEPQVFEALYARDAEARERGIAVVPGVGFDVVPSNCLAAHVVRRAGTPRSLELTIAALGAPSAGTVKSAVPILLGGGRVYRQGRKQSTALGRSIKRVRLSSREVWAVPAPISDLDAAFHATHVPDVTVYYALPSRLARVARLTWPLGVVALPALRAVASSPRLDGFIERRVKGTDAEQRARGRSYLYGMAEGEGGERVEAWLEVPEAYDFTGHSAVRCVERLLSRRPRGALAPVTAFGEDLVTELPGCTLLDRLPFNTR